MSTLRSGGGFIILLNQHHAFLSFLTQLTLVKYICKLLEWQFAFTKSGYLSKFFSDYTPLKKQELQRDSIAQFPKVGV